VNDSSADKPTAAEEASLARLRGAALLAGLSGRVPEATPRSEIAFSLARELAATAPEPDRDLIPEAARLQEAGKIYVPAEILARPAASLSEDERKQLGEHFEHGRRLALGAGIPSRACSWILHARERWDGEGPAGLGGEDIPLGSRVIAVCREYLDTPTAPGESDPQALRDAAAEHLQSVAGTLLDPALAARAVELSGGHADRR
jgi:HD-GYP domain-containing protein (c-di-GMP phosphodiesterase class II)